MRRSLSSLGIPAGLRFCRVLFGHGFADPIQLAGGALRFLRQSIAPFVLAVEAILLSIDPFGLAQHMARFSPLNCR
jgi:hypothetical protein